MSFQIETATRSKAKMRMSLAGPSGSGKTYSALLLAYGLTNNWNTIGVIDTERRSASLYSHLGEYKVIVFEPPYHPTRYIEAIETFEQAGIEVIIIDSVSHVWKGEGGLLEYQNSLGGRFQDWAKATPLYQRFLNAILGSKAHVITTIRKKESYSLETENGKSKVTKQGLDDEIRDGFSYEMTVAFDININHLAEASKDRTGLFMKPGKVSESFVITEETGKMIKEWANTGREVTQTGEPILDSTQLKKIHALGLALGYSNKESESRVLEYYKKSDLKEITKSQGEGMIKALTEKVKLKEAEEANKLLTDKQTDKLVEEAVQDSFIEGLEKDKEGTNYE